MVRGSPLWWIGRTALPIIARNLYWASCVSYNRITPLIFAHRIYEADFAVPVAERPSAAERKEIRMNRIMSFLAGAFCGAGVGGVAARRWARPPGRDLQPRARERIDGLVEDARRAPEARRAQ